MKSIILAMILFMSSLDTTAQVKTSWAFNYRFQNFSPNVGTHLMLDEHGNVYNTGFSAGSPGRNDMVLIKFEENGNMQWLNRYSDTITPLSK